jgi:hypothetical protein
MRSYYFGASSVQQKITASSVSFRLKLYTIYGILKRVAETSAEKQNSA